LLIFTGVEDEILAQKKIAGNKGSFYLNESWFCWNFEPQKAQDGITEGQQAQPQEKTASNWRGLACGVDG
jgi:formamidopyrimidine-DNA glycosylase